MARARTHKDVEFHVEVEGETRVFDTFAEGAAKAVDLALAKGEAVLDVVVWSEKGARWLGGDDAVEAFREDPDASVFERIVVKAHSQGRVP